MVGRKVDQKLIDQKSFDKICIKNISTKSKLKDISLIYIRKY